MNHVGSWDNIGLGYRMNEPTFVGSGSQNMTHSPSQPTNIVDLARLATPLLPELPSRVQIH